ncbi:MAG: 4Fe-4S dicluster domain-containing protein [Halodesulfurarchaeum sp.]
MSEKSERVEPTPTSDASPGVPEMDESEESTDESSPGCNAAAAVGSEDGLSRRDVMKGAAGGAAVAGLPSLADLLGPIEEGAEELYQKITQEHWELMTEAEREELVAHLEEEYRSEYDRDVDVAITEPPDDVVFGYALNINRCIGCRKCVYACVEENNQSRASPQHPAATQIQWIRVLRFDDFEIDAGEPKDIGTAFGNVKAGINFEESSHFYDPEEVPDPEKFYMPVQCQQCEDPPCVKVCPTQATWKEEDGIVTIDYRWCIGCKYCIVACPYYARRFNLSEPYIPEDELNPDTCYLGNRPRPHEVVEKCTFCMQRSREGEYPACVEACPVGARKFGNLLDEESEVRRIIDDKRVFRLKEDLGTEPKFFYFMN